MSTVVNQPAAGRSADFMLELSKARSLSERLDLVEARFGASIAQHYIASGAISEAPRTLLYRDLIGMTRARANALTRFGVDPTDVVAALLPISFTSYPTMIATMAAATLASINYFLEAEALINLVRLSGASVLLTAGRYEDDPQCAGKIARIRAALPALRHIVFDGDELPDGAVSMESLAAGEAQDRWPDAPRSAMAERVLALFHTGGTTGLPKLVPHTQSMYLAMADACARAQGTCHGDTVMAPFPLFHVSGALQGGLVPLLSGATLVVPASRGFRSPELLRDYWRFVERHRVNVIAGVPTALAALAATPPDADTSCVQRALAGGAPLSVHVIEALRNAIPGLDFLEGWGMTETCGFSVLNPPGRSKVGAVGFPFPGVDLEVRKADATGALALRCAVDEIGEVVVRGKIVIQRYHDERPDSFIEDDWLRTGDRGRLDTEGYLWITGRVKDLIIRGGHNIEPSLIEEPAYQHPAVQLAAAVGRPDRHAGELPVLYVQLKPNAQASEEAIAAFIAPLIQERAAIPKAIHILPQLPLNGPGKISKLQLRREAARATLQADVDSVMRGHGQEVRVSVDDDARYGQIAELHAITGDVSESAREAVNRALAGYTLRSRWHQGTS